MATFRRLAVLSLVVALSLGACAGPEPAAVTVTAAATARAATPTGRAGVPTEPPSPQFETSTPPTATDLPPAATSTLPASTAPVPAATLAPTAAPFSLLSVTARLEKLSFDRFLDDSYTQLLLRNPEGLTYAGVSALFGLRNDRLNNLSAAFVQDTQALEDSILALLRSYDRGKLSPEQQISYDVYEWYLDNQARGREFIDCEYPVHHTLGSYDVELIRLFAEIQPLTNRLDMEDYVARLSQVDDQVLQVLENLRRREAKGVVPPRFVLDMALPNLWDIARSTARSTPFYTAFASKTGTLVAVSDADRQFFRQAVETEIARSVIPAFEALAEYLEIQRASATDDAGLWKLPNGEACYAYLLRRATSTDLTAGEIHAIGLVEVARVQAELRAAFDELGYPQGADLGTLMERAIDEGGYLDTQTQAGKDRAVATFEALLDQMGSRLSGVVDLWPRAEIAVIGDLNGGGYYVPGSRDGSRPGAFHAYVGGAALAKYRIAPVAYHEGVPGHGFQMTIAQELDLPILRTDLFFNGYVEGWALYSERLAWELGAYDDDPYGNIGRLQLELLRAVRLVADTGIHAKRWTRDQAKEYMNEALGDPTGRSSSEVDRYVVLPGQATGYMIGMLRILALRQQAMDELGDRFDLTEFHHTVLGNGAVPLETLDRLVEAAIARQKTP